MSPPPTHLLELYEQVATSGGDSMSAALRELSAATGMKIYFGTWSRWRRGIRTPPPEVVQHMAQRVVAAALEKYGVDTLALDGWALDGIALALCPPVRVRA